MRLTILFSSFILMLSAAHVYAAEDHKILANAYVQEKSKITGSLDLYDEKLNKVRNLKFIEWADSDEKTTGEGIVLGEFRDLSNGDILNISIFVQDEKVAKAEIDSVKVKAVEANKEALNKKFSQDEVRVTITSYIEQKSEFSKTFDIFDPDAQKFLKLNFEAFNGDMRNFGVLYIQTVDFSDSKSSNAVSCDITVENVQGSLKVKTVKRK